ncbi:serine/threonine protein kinase [Gloeobacter morelensis]|uniref:Serine/threonine protein kinase n=1 Tax=Gloeobacter morelensis MG652769 TaxID=2781736 RepID=A0ABY3PK54_9CYAN|nr:serine/threonine-protein kinase [Gloeobacter morelensis]UFP94050.1 serine/threonine protein kinase [Gloeobacter morelensis MG652769]
MPFTPGAPVQDRYLLERQLGSTGARQTWLVQNSATGQALTLKALYFGTGMDWQNLTLFEREAQTLKNLDHPRIPRYHEFFQWQQPEGDYFCLVQDYIPGVSLAEQVHSGKRWSEAQIEQAALEILHTLDYLHSLAPPVIHRDIKPSNVICREDGRLYLVDFGSVQAEQVSGRTVTVVGTYGYMAPEQFGGRAVPGSDLYSLGATLVHLATGMNPADLVDGGFHIRIPEQLPLSPGLRHWVEKLVDSDLERRFKNACEAISGLRCKDSLAHPCETTYQGRIALRPGRKRFCVEVAAREPAFEDILTGCACFILFVIAAASTHTFKTLEPGGGLTVWIFMVLLTVGFWGVLVFTAGNTLLRLMCCTCLEVDRELFTLSHWILGKRIYNKSGRVMALLGKQRLSFDLTTAEHHLILAHVQRWLNR